MSDREFENYLALLSSLLRLDRKQRASIADELRAHLEDRLEELLACGRRLPNSATLPGWRGSLGQFPGTESAGG